MAYRDSDSDTAWELFKAEIFLTNIYRHAYVYIYIYTYLLFLIAVSYSTYMITVNIIYIYVAVYSGLYRYIQNSERLRERGREREIYI